MRKNVSTYNPQLLAEKKGIPLEEAIKIVEERKKRSSGSLESYIQRHGEEEGVKRYNAFRAKSAHSLESYINKYGETDGPLKYQLYLKKKDSRSPAFFKNKYGANWEEEYNNFINRWKYKLSKPYFIEKYGEEEGIEKYNQMTSKKKITLEVYEEKYGKEEGKRRFLDLCERRDSSSLDFYLRKYGEEDGKILFTKKQKASSPIYNQLLKIFPYEEANNEYQNYIITKKINTEVEKEVYTRLNKFHTHVKRSPVSKQSIHFFNHLEIILGYELQYGTREQEFLLFNQENKKLYMYDCYDKVSNTIIEYNGSLFHYHYSFPEDWTDAFGKSKEYIMVRDGQKRDYALKCGYNFLYVWDFETNTITKRKQKALEIKEVLNGFYKEAMV